jgi:endothelin-converting enzyme
LDAEQGREMEGLPGLEEWTDEQLFFLAFGNTWCGMVSDDGLKSRLGRPGGAPNWARIMGPTANSRAFREAFGCRVQESTCELW